MKALFFNDFGDASVLQYGEVADPIVTANTVLVKTTYIGLNFADIYRRRGTYHLEKHQPYIDGYEGVGTVVAVGKQVANFKRGDRVLFVDVPFANASLVAVPADQAIKVPRAINDQQVASIGLQGMTAEFLVHDLAQNQPHDRVLIHGISGGVGQLLTQLLVANEVAVYGVASTLNWPIKLAQPPFLCAMILGTRPIIIFLIRYLMGSVRHYQLVWRLPSTVGGSFFMAWQLAIHQ